MVHQRLTVQTDGPGLYEITTRVAECCAGQGDGVLHLFVRHTSASLLIQENADPSVQDDLAAFFHRLVPPSDDASMVYLTHIFEGPDDMPAHIKAALLPTCLTVPVSAGKMQLGTWQGIYLFEHRSRPHSREILATYQPI